MENQWRTSIPPVQSVDLINHSHKLITVGSCFSDSIGQNLKVHKFNCLVNPLGTIFHPLAINRLLSPIPNDVLEKGFVQRDNEWFNCLFHSKFHSESKKDLLESIQGEQQLLLQQIKQSDILFITWGTAFIYELIEQKLAVANCHKMPSSIFNRRLCSVEEIKNASQHLFLHLKKVNPNLRIILTVSPVRHTRDTLILNSVSKSTLRVAAHTLSEELPFVNYFPAYELMMDDLRDYRFYDSDLIHPNQTAIDYIWDYFQLSYLSKSSRELIEKWRKIWKSIQHKPFNNASPSYLTFLNQLEKDLSSFPKEIDVQKELLSIREKINRFRK